MSQMIGASVEDLRALGKEMARDADRLQAVASELRATPRGVWLGSDSQQFFSKMESSLIPQLNSVLGGLRSAAQILQRNAQEQEETSGSLSGPGGPEGLPGGDAMQGGLPLTPQDVAAIIRSGGGYLMDGAGLVIGAADLLHDPARAMGLVDGLAKHSTIMSGAGVVISGFEAGEALLEGEHLQTVVSTMKAGAAVWGGPAGFVVGLGLDAYEEFIPLTGERQDAVLDAYRMRTYGTTELTYEQASAVAERYQGFSGYGHFLVDSAREAIENPDGFISTAVGAADDAADWVRGLFGNSN